MVIRSVSGEKWSVVALRLGFHDLSAWTNFVKRLVGLTPSQAERVSLEVWETRIMEVIGGNSPRRGAEIAPPHHQQEG